MKVNSDNILTLIETYFKKKLVFAHALLPFGTIWEVNAQNSTFGNPNTQADPSVAKRAIFFHPHFEYLYF
jgi:hypothetical protein